MSEIRKIKCAIDLEVMEQVGSMANLSIEKNTTMTIYGKQAKVDLMLHGRMENTTIHAGFVKTDNKMVEMVHDNMDSKRINSILMPKYYERILQRNNLKLIRKTETDSQVILHLQR